MDTILRNIEKNIGNTVILAGTQRPGKNYSQALFRNLMVIFAGTGYPGKKKR